MRRGLLILLIAIFSAGCHKKHPGISIAVEPVPASLNVLMWGQSNTEPRFHLGEYFLSANTAAIKTLNFSVRGATYLSEWEPGNPLYDQLVDGLKTADVVIFWQGEADAHDLALTQTWASRWERIIEQARAEAGRSPLILGVVVGKGDISPAWDELQRQQRTAYSRVANVTAVELGDIDDSLRLPNDVHYTDAGYRFIAQRLAGIYQEDD